VLAPSPAYPPPKKKFNIQHSTFNIQKNESEHLENNSADSHQHTDRYRYYARSNELHGIKKLRNPVIKVTVIKVIKDFQRKLKGNE